MTSSRDALRVSERLLQLIHSGSLPSLGRLTWDRTAPQPHIINWLRTTLAALNEWVSGPVATDDDPRIRAARELVRSLHDRLCPRLDNIASGRDGITLDDASKLVDAIVILQDAALDDADEPEPACSEPEGSGASARRAGDDLTETEDNILKACGELGAYDLRSARTKDEIARRAGYTSSAARNVRSAFESLKARGITTAKRKSGTWLTHAGREFVS